MGISTNVERSIEEIDTSRWDNIADLCFLKSDTLKIVERLELGSDPYYLEVFEDGKLCAVAVFYGQKSFLYPTINEVLFGRYNKYVGPVFGLLRPLICHFPYTPFYEMFKIRDSSEKKRVFKRIENELKNIAKSNGYGSYGFQVLEDKELVRDSGLIPIFSGFKVRAISTGRRFEDFISAQKRTHKKTIKKERRLFENSEFKVERHRSLGKDEKKVLEIFNGNFSKYGVNEEKKIKLTKEYIRALSDESNRMNFFLGKIEGKIISAFMAMEDEDRLVGMRVGQDKSLSGGFIFYNIAFYEPLIYAINAGKSYLELGTGSYNYKIRRGAKVFDSFYLVNSTNRFKNLYLIYIIAILDRRNRKKHFRRLNQKGV